MNSGIVSELKIKICFPSKPLNFTFSSTPKRRVYKKDRVSPLSITPVSARESATQLYFKISSLSYQKAILKWTDSLRHKQPLFSNQAVNSGGKLTTIPNDSGPEELVEFVRNNPNGPNPWFSSDFSGQKLFRSKLCDASVVRGSICIAKNPLIENELRNKDLRTNEEGKRFL